MAKWKELGEVPDSDDESTWDSQESLPNLVAPVPARADGADGGDAEDAEDAQEDVEFAGNRIDEGSHAVWDIPFSSQVSDQQESASSPKPRRIDPSPSSVASPIYAPQPEPTPSPPPLLLSRSGHTAGSDIPRSSPVGGHEVERSVPALLPLDAPDFGGDPETSEGGRLGRSLRPRKPIQEHPYLLENVQYSKTWKSHGLRPVRVVAEERARRQEEDSQEQDFEDDSQATTVDAGQEELDESQATNHVKPHRIIEDILLSDDEEPSLTPSGRSEHTQQNSQEQEEEEFPDPNDVAKWKSNKTTNRARKRQSSPKVSSKQKVPKLTDPIQLSKDTEGLSDVDDVFDIPVSPPQTSPEALAITPMTIINQLGGEAVTKLTPKRSSTISSRIHSPTPTRQHDQLIDLTMLDNESGDASDGASSHMSSENELDRVRLGAKRIRGVLPASWLRLDQQSSLQNTKPGTRRRSPDLSPKRSIRKGVAQRRLSLPQREDGSTLFLDDSDDSDSTVRPRERNTTFHDFIDSTMEDDAVSIIEEDHIDRMFSRGKRSSTDSGDLQRKRKRSQKIQRKRQQRITSLMGPATVSDKGRKRLRIAKDGGEVGSTTKQKTNKRRSPEFRPPRLSILDVVEPDAPVFIRIAARTVSRRRDLGRSSPSGKVIMLGSRQDSVDATKVLNRWSEGMIQPKDTLSPVSLRSCQDEKAKTPKVHSIPASQPPKTQITQTKTFNHFSQPRRIVKQVSMDNFIDVGMGSQTNLSVGAHGFRIEAPKLRDASHRPAQLEVSGDSASRYTFSAQKRALDAIYRRSLNSSSAARNLYLEESMSRQVSAHQQQPMSDVLKFPKTTNTPGTMGLRKRPKLRKQAHPQAIDISAPQYTHANDPLPREPSPLSVVSDRPRVEDAGKLNGLAPYGTHYTQHFEIFPLDHGVFFHENTIIGDGRLKRALDGKIIGNMDSPRGQCTFTIDEQVLNWGPWDAQTSSEVGILFDWVAEQLDTSSSDLEPRLVAPVRAADFVLTYLQDHLSFCEREASNIFVSRFVDVLQAFERRLKEISSHAKLETRPFIEVMTRILVIVVRLLRLCQKFQRVPESFQVEEILKQVAATTAGVLLKLGLGDLYDLYGRSQQASFREQGIQHDNYCLICWVILIRILEEVRLPRSGFWEVISPTILGPNVDAISDAAVLENAWRTLFTLLPLGEFDTMGVVSSGMRHTTPLEGWKTPQRLLRRVFQLYQSNTRQSPSFNDYLRAIISRCHYLVEQWGWHKCHTILGTIFDFFAAQDLHNLRNEEVYQSPPFLEELSESPLLATSSGDRCFHIFLKLIAMSIRKLIKLGMMKEIKNLVARLLPNHSRQYDKIMATHEAEIAALRNHHDLLCTLFWTAPPDLRPSIQSIEGLVIIGSSHKEACLINLRTWSRLARFIVSSGEDISAYKPLADWQRNIFQQVLEQFLSVEAEVNQQLMGMTAEASKNVTQQQKDAVIRRNKRVSMDLLYFLTNSFLEVLRQAHTLGVASFALNMYPLDQIFTRLTFSSRSSDWGILKVALDILDYFLTRIDGFASAEPLHVGESWHEENAIMLLERKFAAPLIAVARSALNIEPWGVGARQGGDHGLCLEQAVALVGRLGACLVHTRLARLRHFFQSGKYGLFQDMMKPVVSISRKYVALFLATVMDRGITDFKDIGATVLDLFLAEITKPYEYLGYEDQLARSFKLLGEPCLEKVEVQVGKMPTYSSNRALFNHTIVSMRKVLHKTDSDQKAHLQNAYTKALRLTMERMKADLKLMKPNSSEHLNYVDFVRLIISIIRSQDLCPVDPFFYQINQEYSPPRQDPRLQTAAILSWGLKLEEGDSKAVSGLFYLLFPSFKIAVANGELANEAQILTESMKHEHVFNFMLSTMLPAIIKTATATSEGWVVLKTYVEAIDAQLSLACIHSQIAGDTMIDILALHSTVLAGIANLRTRASPDICNRDIIALTVMIEILNLLSPSVTAYLINEPDSPLLDDYTNARADLTAFTHAADVYLTSLAQDSDEQNTITAVPCSLFDGLHIVEPLNALQCNEQITRFANYMIQDIRQNWISNEDSITIKGPSRAQRPSATQSGQGTCHPKWDRQMLIRSLRDQIRTWNHAHDMMMETTLREAISDELLF